MFDLIRLKPFSTSPNDAFTADVEVEVEHQQWLEADLVTDVIDRRRAASQAIVLHFDDRLRSMRVLEDDEDPDRGSVWTLEVVALTSEAELEVLCNQLILDIGDIRPA